MKDRRLVDEERGLSWVAEWLVDLRTGEVVTQSWGTF